MNIQIGVPVRFLCIQWHEDWEFDHPVCLLEPVVRYSPYGGQNEGMIEDIALDIQIALEKEQPIEDEDVSREFEWRGWSLRNLKRCARMALKGKRFPVKNYHATEQWVTFRPSTETNAEPGELEFVRMDRRNDCPAEEAPNV